MLPKQILFQLNFAFVKISNIAVVGVFLEGSARQQNVAVHVGLQNVGFQNDFEFFGLEGNIRPPAYCGNCFLQTKNKLLQNMQPLKLEIYELRSCTISEAQELCRALTYFK